MNSCNQYQQKLSALIDGELDDRQAQQLLEHTRTCDRCRLELAEQRIVAGVMREGLAANVDLSKYQYSPLAMQRGLVAMRRGVMVRAAGQWALVAASILVACSIWLAIDYQSDNNAIPASWERMALVNDAGTPAETFVRPNEEMELALLLVGHTFEQQDKSYE